MTSGAWIACPRCGVPIGLARFVADDEEPGAAVAVCETCHERVVISSPPEPDGR